MIKVAVIDDDGQSLKTIKNYIERYKAEQGGDYSVSCFDMGIEFISDYKAEYDIIFMDINMPLMNGMEVVRKLREIDNITCVIFITNLAQYALKGYEVNALDFMLKPVEYVDFSLKFEKAVRYSEKFSNKSCLMKTDNGIVRLNYADIQYIESGGHYLFFHTTQGVYTRRGRLNDLEASFTDSGFARCNVSYLINLEHVKKLENSCVTVGEDLLPISRSKYAEFVSALTRYFGGGVL